MKEFLLFRKSKSEFQKLFLDWNARGLTFLIERDLHSGKPAVFVQPGAYSVKHYGLAMYGKLTENVAGVFCYVSHLHCPGQRH